MNAVAWFARKSRISCTGFIRSSWAPKTEALEATRAKTPTGRLVEMRDVTDAAVFLLENPSMHGTELRIDGGWSLT